MQKINQFQKIFKTYLYYIRNKTSNLPPPFRLWIELTNVCNYKCVMCPTGQRMFNNQGFMSFDLFKEIIDQCKGYVHNINLFHRGESLLHKDIEKFIIHANENGVLTNLHTNGSLLTKDKSRMILRSGLDLLSFSFDGFDAKTYEKIRVKGDFNKTVNNIKNFLELKKAQKSTKPFTIIECLNINGLAKKRLDEKNQFINKFKDLPLDKFVVKDVHNFAGDASVSDNGNKYSRKPRSCTLLWYSMTILWDGTVLPCPQDFLERYTIGDLKYEKIMDIWNGEKLQFLRRKMVLKDLSDFPHCVSCDRIHRKAFLGIPREGIKKFFHANLFRNSLRG